MVMMDEQYFEYTLMDGKFYTVCIYYNKNMSPSVTFVITKEKCSVNEAGRP